MVGELDADYLVVGAGAAGLAFTDALVDHDPDVHVALVERRDGVGGHWRAAYPFVRLHQASQFYGVASTVMGGGVQQSGPEAGLYERADQPAILDYYERLLATRLAGRVSTFFRHSHADGLVVPIDGGEPLVVPEHCRIVDARYLAPEVPAEWPPRFRVVDGACVVPVNDLPQLGAHSEYVIVGSGKTATDAIVWLLGEGIEADAITWVRPRDPWMLNRAVVQPDPAVFLGMAATVMQCASEAVSLPDLFLALESAGVMLRLDRAVEPTMAKTPTLATWELDLLRSVERVVRLGRIRSVERGHLHLDGGTVDVAADAVVVNCAADGLKNPARVPIWSSEAITLQPIRAGFPCFGAALAGYVEATRDDDAVKNALCAPSSYGNSLEEWAVMNVMGTLNAAAFSAEPDIASWASTVAINPARVPPHHPGSPALDAALDRLATFGAAGVARLAELAVRSSHPL